MAANTRAAQRAAYELQRTQHMSDVAVGDIADAMLAMLVIVERYPDLLDATTAIYTDLAAARAGIYALASLLWDRMATAMDGLDEKGE